MYHTTRLLIAVTASFDMILTSGSVLQILRTRPNRRINIIQRANHTRTFQNHIVLIGKPASTFAVGLAAVAMVPPLANTAAISASYLALSDDAASSYTYTFKAIK